MVRDLSQLVKNAKPTPFHNLLASLSKEGRLLRLYTQNVDGLDTSMEPLGTVVPLPPKGPWPRTIQLHGGLEKMVCSKCSEISQFDAYLFEGPQAPLCKGCEETDNVRTSHAGKRSHGIGRLRPRMVLYNEYNPDEEAIANVFRADLRARPDAVIVVGTSMKIPGVRNMVKDMCKVTRDRRDGITAWINLDPEPSGTDLKNCWDLVVRGKCDDVASLVHLPHFDEHVEQGEDTIVDDAKYENVRRVKLEVEIRRSHSQDSTTVKESTPDVSSPIEEAKPQSLERIQGIPTPSASPKIRTALPTKPVPKSNQTKLSFSSCVSKASTSIAKGSKKSTQRKPKQAKNPKPKPKATINTAFKATKSNRVVLSKVPASRELETEPTALGKVSSETKARSVLLADFSLRPRGNKRAVDAGSVVSAKSSRAPTPLSGFDKARPSTPEQQTLRRRSQDTVSPPSKPRGFGTLID